METPKRPYRVGNLNFEAAELDRAVERALDDALSGRSRHLHFANAWSIALANDDEELRSACQEGINYPDGKPVVWAMKWLYRGERMPPPCRVDGPTFFEMTLRDGVDQHVRHYFLGSTPDTLGKLQANVRNRFPGVDIVGVSSPPFKELTPDDLAYELVKIEASRPDFVWIGLGTPKQDKVAAFLALRYRAVFACVGAAFDYTAGNLRETPRWMQGAGLGWLYRFVQEPRRLWRRYTYGNAKFIRIVLTQLMTRRASAKN